MVRRTDEIGTHDNILQGGKRSRVTRNGYLVAWIIGNRQHRHLVTPFSLAREQLSDGIGRNVHLERGLILLAGNHPVVHFERRCIFPVFRIAIGHLAREKEEIHPGDQVLMIAAHAFLRTFRLCLDGVVAHQRQLDAGGHRGHQLLNTCGRQTNRQTENDMTNASHAIMD